MGVWEVITAKSFLFIYFIHIKIIMKGGGRDRLRKKMDDHSFPGSGIL